MLVVAPCMALLCVMDLPMRATLAAAYAHTLRTGSELLEHRSVAKPKEGLQS